MTRPPRLRRARSRLVAVGRALDEADVRAYRAIASIATPRLDPVLAGLSDAANHSKVWMGAAALLAVCGGRRGRRAAALALRSVIVTSVIANVVVKPATFRVRPDRSGALVPEARWVRMPSSRSFPSGHSASAFAFATAAGAVMPELRWPLRAVATAIAYSRVHTGVHYPGDVIGGAALGITLATVVERRRAPEGI